VQESKQYEPEAHHSLRAPLDKSLVYWNFGGSTVLTKHLIRLTPSTQDRRGWLWNEYPLESANWEVEVKLEVFSKPHFGGDGFGLWVLAGEQDPSFSQNPEALSGNLFGLKSDFKGFGVVVDVYDNDNRRNNPSVFVLSNSAAAIAARGTPAPNWNHDNDYEDNMVKTLPTSDDLGGLAPPTAAHKCVADIRNTGKVSRMLVKYLHRVLHVYIDNSEGAGWKFCLAVKLDDDFKDHHLAFTAATGQVADNHDIMEITTRYLKSSDLGFDDASLAAMSDRGHSHHSSWFTLYWLVQSGLQATVLGLAVWQLHTYHTLQSQRIDLVQICARLNPAVLPHYALHALLTIFLLLGGCWWNFLLHAPLVGWRAFEFAKKNFLFSPANIGPSKGHAVSLVGAKSVYVKLGVPSVIYALCELYYLKQLLVG
jgi:hypothetical protein